MTILVNLLALAVILLIVWWFWFSKPRRAIELPKDRPIEVVVENGVYQPALIEGEHGARLQLRFIRKDASPCAEKVIFPELGVSRDLAMNQPEDFELVVEQPGRYEFICQMAMYRGVLVIK